MGTWARNGLNEAICQGESLQESFYLKQYFSNVLVGVISPMCNYWNLY